MHFCRRCETHKSVDEMKKGSRTCCKKCNSKEKVQYWSNLSKHEKRERSAKRYGIDKETFDQMFSEQKGKCKICDISLVIPEANTRPKNRACIDHDHKTGMVRGLLCSNCNLALGFLSDSEETVSKALEYLKEYKHGIHRV